MATITVFPENQLLEKSVCEILKMQRQMHDDYLIIDVNLYRAGELIVSLFDYVDRHFSGFNGITLVLYEKNTRTLANYICANFSQQMKVVPVDSRAPFNEIMERVLYPYAALNTEFRSRLTSQEFNWLKLFYGGLSISDIAEQTSKRAATLYAKRSTLVKKVFGDTVRTTKRLWPPQVL